MGAEKPTTESALLQRIAGRTARIESFGSVVVGPGDDCAVVRSASGDLLLIGVDQLVEGRHFEAGTEVELIARKAVARAVSDIAAMGGAPAWGLATGLLPDGYGHGGELVDAIHEAGEAMGCPIVGGDIAFGPGPLALTVTAAGTAHTERGPVMRSGAEPGDGVYATGALGGSFASRRHLVFDPRVREAEALCDALGAGLHAMIDISDGLGRDAGRIGEASGARLVLEAGAFPLHDGCGWAAGLGDGEDYELLFTASPRVRVPGVLGGTPVTRIGRVEAGGPGAVVETPDGETIPCGETGWDHGGAGPGPPDR